MIIDARTVFETKHGRPYTISAAVANALDTIPVHGSVDVAALIDAFGESAPRSRIDMLVCKHKGDRRFAVRAGRNGNLATITRLA